MNIFFCFISVRTPTSGSRVSHPTFRFFFSFGIPQSEGRDRDRRIVVSPTVINPLAISDDDSRSSEEQRDNLGDPSVFQGFSYHPTPSTVVSSSPTPRYLFHILRTAARWPRRLFCVRPRKGRGYIVSGRHLQPGRLPTRPRAPRRLRRMSSPLFPSL